MMQPLAADCVGTAQKNFNVRLHHSNPNRANIHCDSDFAPCFREAA